MKKKYGIIKTRQSNVIKLRHRNTGPGYDPDKAADDMFDDMMNTDDDSELADKIKRTDDYEEADSDDDSSDDDDDSEEDEVDDQSVDTEDSDDDEEGGDDDDEEFENDENDDDQQDEDEDDDESDENDESDDDVEDGTLEHYRSELSIVRRRKKELLKEKKDLEREQQKLIERAEKAESEVIQLQNYQVPLEEHPEYKEKAQRLHEVAEEAVSGLTRLSPKQRIILNEKSDKILNRLATIAKEKDFSKKTDAYEAFDLTVAKALDLIDHDVEEFDRNMDGAAIDAMAALRQSLSPAVRELQDLAGIRDNLQEKIKNGTMETDHRQFTEKSNRTKKLLLGASTISDTIAKKNPKSLHTITAKLIKSDAKFRAKAEVIDEMLINIRHGIEPLTQEEIDGLRAGGEDIDAVKTRRAIELRQLEDETIPKLKYALLYYDKFEAFAKEHGMDLDQALQKSKARRSGKVGRKVASKVAKRKEKPDTLENAQDAFNKMFDDQLS